MDILSSLLAQKLVGRYPRFFQFIKDRLNRKKFSGLSLTFLALSFFYIIFLFGGVIEGIITSEPIISTDIRINGLLIIFRNPELIKFFLWITLLGKWQVVSVFIATSILILLLKRLRVYIAPLLLTLAGSTIFEQLGKMIFHRPRPELAVYLEKSFSFPSGHATIAVAFYGFLTYIILRQTKKWRTKVNVFFAGAALIALIGFSRLYLGVHYVSDVWSGYLIGAIWLIIGISICEYLFSRREKQ